MRKAFAYSATFICTIIGAGFASGREIALYFGTLAYPWVLVSAGVLSALAFVFLEVGRISDGKPSEFLLGKYAYVLDGFIVVSNFIVIIAMVAGADFIVYDAFGVSFGGVITAIFALTIATRLDKLKLVNTVLLPVIIVFVTLLFFNTKAIFGGEASLARPVLYASLNISAGGLILSKCPAISRKNSVACAVIIFALLAFLMSAEYFVVRIAPSDMPVLSFARSLHLGAFAQIFIYIAIFTTLASSLTLASGYSTRRGALIIFIACPLALVGFARFVNFTYPAIGVGGAVIAFIATFRVIFCGQKNIVIEERCLLLPKRKP